MQLSLDEHGRDRDVSLQQAEEEFLSLDDIARTPARRWSAKRAGVLLT